MCNFTLYLEKIAQFIWLGPLLVLLLAVGIYQTWRLRGIQFRYFFHSIGLVFSASDSKNAEKNIGDVSSFQALMTALAGAIGTGNITGIATAVVTGGFGALFWMWIIALIGMATAYSEATLAICYRQRNSANEMSGGPMYTLLNGLGANKSAKLFACFAAIAAFGIGSLVQSNSVADAIFELCPLPYIKLMTGIVLAGLVGAVILGGIKSIANVAGYLVPAMGIGYLFAGIVVLIVNYTAIPGALSLIISSAFTGQAAIGAFAGASVWAAIQMGFSNGLFANEAGLGSLSIAAASANVEYPAKQGMFAICGVFISTLVICTITGLVLAVTNVLGNLNASGSLVTGSPLAMAAFASVHSSFAYLVVLGLIFFAFTTILAWAYYGEKCCEFLFGFSAVFPYRYVYILFVILGSVADLNLVWALSNIANGLMAPLNLYSIFRLSHRVDVETKDYELYLAKKNGVKINHA